MYLLYYNMKNMNIQEHFFEKTLDFLKKRWYNTLVHKKHDYENSPLHCSARMFGMKRRNHAMDMIQAFVNEQLKPELPQFEIGDTVRVHNKIKEGEKERIQLFEGTVIAKRNGGISETFTVRRIAYGVGVEKTFPIHSPNVVKVDVIRVGKVRRAKLYYLRDRVGKAAKTKEKI